MSQDEIATSIAAVAERISTEYRNRDLILIAVLKGAFVFLADLIRQLSISVKIDFLRVASYGEGTSSSGTVELTKDIELDIKSKDVILIEDIIDTGFTVKRILNHLNSLGPNSVRICALIDKRERRETPINIDYGCHIVEKGFLVGYGLDYAEDYRHLPGVFELKF